VSPKRTSLKDNNNLNILKNCGLTNTELNAALLNHFNDDVGTVISILMKKDPNAILTSCGFTNTGLNSVLLKQFNDDVVKVINILKTNK